MSQLYGIRKDDTVKVIAGKERGKTGKVLRVDHKHGRAVIEKLNFIKRHVRSGHPSAPRGGIIEREGPLPLTNLMVVCPKCGEQTRVRYEKIASGARLRICRKCSETID